MKIAVVGKGTAGITSLCHMLKWTEKGSTVTAIYDPTVKIFGIGESMEPNFVTALAEGCNFDFLKDCQELDATLKLGVKWKDWRREEFTASPEGPIYSIHFNNHKLPDFCIERFKQIWPEKFQEIIGTVSRLENKEKYAAVIVDGTEHHFDYVIDCRGAPTDFTDYVLVDQTVNHAIVYSKKEPGTWLSTVHQAHKDGWMFGIPLQSYQGWGYLYNDNITSKEEAISNMEELLGVKEVPLAEYSFKSFYAKKFLDGRILKNGNASFFIEPLAANAGLFYLTSLKYLMDHIYGHVSEQTVNDELTMMAKDLELFINFAYHGGSMFDTPFWSYIKKQAKNKLNSSPRWAEIVNAVRSRCYKNEVIQNDQIARWSVKHWLMWDKNLGYNYFYDKNI